MVTISLCMIVKNEESVLGRILAQMKEIADEIIIVDTGSADKTKEIARQYTDKIYDYAWRQDFAAARNFACSKATMDYWMWLDADDVITENEQQKLLKLKKLLNTSADVVMMRYLTGFDENGDVTFSCYRERLFKNHSGFLWEGRVHEAVTPRGNILYVPIAIEHRKINGGDPNRNLNIYQEMLLAGEALAPRHRYYYGRELFTHNQFSEAADYFTSVIDDPTAWIENRIEACLLLARCRERLGQTSQRLEALAKSFFFCAPRAEICCEIGRLLMEHGNYSAAIFWYHAAFDQKPSQTNHGFIETDSYDFLPAVQLCVCFDRLDNREQAIFWHQEAKKRKPNSPIIKYNDDYFSRTG